jgi:hypothetical protein
MFNRCTWLLVNLFFISNLALGDSSVTFSLKDEGLNSSTVVNVGTGDGAVISLTLDLYVSSNFNLDVFDGYLTIDAPHAGKFQLLSRTFQGDWTGSGIPSDDHPEKMLNPGSGYLGKFLIENSAGSGKAVSLNLSSTARIPANEVFTFSLADASFSGPTGSGTPATESYTLYTTPEPATALLLLASILFIPRRHEMKMKTDKS